MSALIAPAGFPCHETAPERFAAERGLPYGGPWNCSEIAEHPEFAAWVAADDLTRDALAARAAEEAAEEAAAKAKADAIRAICGMAKGDALAAARTIAAAAPYAGSLIPSSLTVREDGMYVLTDGDFVLRWAAGASGWVASNNQGSGADAGAGYGANV